MLIPHTAKRVVLSEGLYQYGTSKTEMRVGEMPTIG